MTKNGDGYLRITAGKHRGRYAHRVYVNRQMQEKYSRDLRSDEEVHHLCRNRTCWPPSDYHLLILDDVIHHALDAGREPGKKRRRKERGGTDGG